MILYKKITIAGESYDLIKEDVTLDAKRPGKGIFTVKATQPLTGLISFDTGYKADKLKTWFFGYIESSTTVDSKQQRIVARELSAALQYPLFLQLRHVTIEKILNAIGEKTGLEFIIGKGDYSQQETPYFYSMGNGYHCLDSIGPAFNIPRFFWQQESNNKIYIGSWNDSHWQNKSAAIDNDWLTQFGTGQRANIPAMPALRPGVELTGLGFIQSIRFTGSTMAITWNKTL